jgi:hypothetical protein
MDLEEDRYSALSVDYLVVAMAGDGFEIVLSAG